MHGFSIKLLICKATKLLATNQLTGNNSNMNMPEEYSISTEPSLPCYCNSWKCWWTICVTISVYLRFSLDLKSQVTVFAQTLWHICCSQAYLYQTHWQNSIIRSPLSLSFATHVQAQILRSLFPKRFSASLELSSQQSQVFLSTNSYTILSNTSSIQHTVSFTQSVPLP